MSRAEQSVSPACGRWLNPPPRSECDHDRVVLLTDVSGDAVDVGGRTVLWCSECEASWWEDHTNVKKS